MIGDISWREGTAIVSDGRAYSYRDLDTATKRVASFLLAGRSDLEEARVAFLTRPSLAYVAAQRGAWRAGGVAVPLCVNHPRPELEYVIADSGASILMADEHFLPVLHPIARARALRLVSISEAFAFPAGTLPDVAPGRRAMIVYTSGTTSRPKGVVSTHAAIRAQVQALLQAWEWSSDDSILHVLPLHHLHGILNVLGCALAAGAECHFLPRFDAEETWNRFLAHPYTLFMAVPTIYVKLIAAWDLASSARQRALSDACRGMRLMVSGSAALPVPVLEKWKEISGHVLLERYGMTEIGMALSNPLHGERRPGTVGVPLPSMEIRCVDEGGAGVEAGTPGELWVRGAGVFREYWNQPEATLATFTDGWFRTGDMAVVDQGYYRLLGRSSVDIIKTGGFKVSALEIEEALRLHPAVEDCAVVGLPDPQWGERVGAALVLRVGQPLSLEALRAWCKERLAPYKTPSQVLLLDSLPRNALGKVLKPELARLFH
ncbi:MAG: AMP-binding protein [Deltaproteobacteria bacterium]|nr:AMP-binding protein [Deltaproteobacteria bacterium]